MQRKFRFGITGRYHYYSLHQELMSDYNTSNKPSKLSDKINEMYADRREDDFTNPIPDNGGRKKTILIGVAIAVLVIIIGVLVFLLLKKNSSNTSNNPQTTEETTDNKEKTLNMPDSISVDALAQEMGISVDEIISICKDSNVEVTGNQMLGRDLIELIAEKRGFKAVFGSGGDSLEDLNRLQLEQKLAQAEFENLEKDFKEMESPVSIKIKDDKIKKQLQEQYNKARLEVEELRKQLKDISNKNSKEIQDLLDQIQTLRDLIKHYLEIIESQDKTIKEQSEKISTLENENSQLKSNVQQTQAQNQELQGRMTLAEKLNVTDVSMMMLNKKGKNESKVKNAKQFVINFAIPQNVSTPVGTKTIYARITTPEGQILEGGGSFAFEGNTIPASASLNVEYGGEEIGGLQIFYDINQALTTGEYSYQLYCDGYELMKSAKRVSFNK